MVNWNLITWTTNQFVVRISYYLGTNCLQSVKCTDKNQNKISHILAINTLLLAVTVGKLALLAASVSFLTLSEMMDGRWMRDDFTNWKKSTSPSDFTRSSWAWMQRNVPVRPIPSLQGETQMA